MSHRGTSNPLAFLRSYVERHPDDAAARHRLASLLAESGEPAAARALLESLSGSATVDERRALADLAILEEDVGHVEKARRLWERLLADDIDDREANAHLGRLGAGQNKRPRPTESGFAHTLGSPEGVKLFRYELVRELGRGSTSTVYLAKDRNLEVEVALKVLHPQLAASTRSAVCRRFFEVARLIAGLRHPGVVTIYDLDEAARALVMEYLPGGTLRDWMRNGQKGTPDSIVDQTIDVSRTLLAALAHVHAQGIIHGDITPRNVLLRNGAAVLADFGSARAFEALGPEVAAGTPLYLAPEQFRGESSGPLADLFAVGAVLWELIAGRPMRTRDDLLANRFTALPFPTGLRQSLPARAHPLVTLVEALVATQPGDRLDSAEAALSLLGA